MNQRAFAQSNEFRSPQPQALAPIRKTPCYEYQGDLMGWDAILLKDETQQVTGAFKFRAVFQKVSRFATKKRLVTASTGNHALAVATASDMLGHEAFVFVPKVITASKLAMIEATGASVTVVDDDYSGTWEQAKEWALRNDGSFLAGFDDPEIVEGHRHLLSEIDEAGITFDQCFVPVGGGGLLAACCLHWPNRLGAINGVEVEGMAAMKESLKAASRVRVKVSNTLAGGLAIPQVGQFPFAVCQSARPNMITVSESEIASAIELLHAHNGIRAEGAAAASLAAALCSPRKGGTCLCLITGGNA